MTNDDEQRKYPFGKPTDPREPVDTKHVWKNPFAGRPTQKHAIVGRLMDSEELAFRGRYIDEAGDSLPDHIQSEFRRGTFKTANELADFLMSQHWRSLIGRDFEHQPISDPRDAASAPVGMGPLVRTLVETDESDMALADVEFYSEKFVSSHISSVILVDVPAQALRVYRVSQYPLEFELDRTLDL